VLIIGGSYFVGRIFVEKLADLKAYDIYIVNRGNKPLGLAGVREIKCDRHSIQLKSHIPNLEWEAVVDFCAYEPVDVIKLFIALESYRVRQYIFISSAGVYKDTSDLPVKETAPKLDGPQLVRHPGIAYRYDKRQTELKVMDLCQKIQIPFTIIRPVMIYGRYNYAPRESYFFDMIRRGEPIVEPSGCLSLFQFVSVWDAAKALCACLQNEKAYNLAFNLAGEELICYRRYYQVLGEITGKKPVIKFMSLQAVQESGMSLPFPLDRHLIYSGRLAQKVLLFDYTPFEEGMRLSWECYLQDNAVP